MTPLLTPAPHSTTGMEPVLVLAHSGPCRALRAYFLSVAVDRCMGAVTSPGAVRAAKPQLEPSLLPTRSHAHRQRGNPPALSSRPRLLAPIAPIPPPPRSSRPTEPSRGRAVQRALADDFHKVVELRQNGAGGYSESIVDLTSVLLEPRGPAGLVDH